MREMTKITAEMTKTTEAMTKMALRNDRNDKPDKKVTEISLH